MYSGSERGKSNHPQERGEEATGSSGSGSPEITTRDASNVSENSETVFRQGEVDGNGSSTSSPIQVGEVDTEGDILTESENYEAFSSSSSRSLSIASSEDLFRVDTKKIRSRSSVSFPRKPNKDSHNIGSPDTSPSQVDTSTVIPRSLVSFSRKPGEDSQPELDSNAGSSPMSSISFSIKPNKDSQPVLDCNVGSPGTSSPESSISFFLKPNEDDRSILDCNIRSPGSSSRVSYSINHLMSPTQTPPIQMMDRSDTYGSSRTSSPESNPTTPQDWRAASSDSLFSLQVGSASFSRELFLISGQGKSEDFENRLDEIGKSEESCNKSGEFFVFSPPSTLSFSVPALEIDRKSVETVRNSDATRIMDEPTKNASRKSSHGGRQVQFRDDVCHHSPPRNSSVTSSYSDGSSSSSHPLTHPIGKKKKSRCPSCCSFGCKWLSSHCSSQNCCTRWSKCLPCCRWNCTKKILCCSCCIGKRPNKSSPDGEDFGKEQKRKHSHQSESPIHKSNPKSRFKSPYSRLNLFSDKEDRIASISNSSWYHQAGRVLVRYHADGEKNPWILD